jgi:hypothetical protein
MRPTSRFKGKWVYLYPAVDSTGATIDFLLSAKRDAAAAERFLAKALGGENHPAPRVINTRPFAVLCKKPNLSAISFVNARWPALELLAPGAGMEGGPGNSESP